LGFIETQNPVIFLSETYWKRQSNISQANHSN